MSIQENPSKETLEKWNKDPNNWIWEYFITTKKTNVFFRQKE